MKYFLILLGLAFSYQSFASTLCQHDSSIIRAEYALVSQTNNSPEQHKKSILWRKNDTVAHQTFLPKMTHVWSKGYNSNIRYSRYFDDYARAIDYQTIGLSGLDGDRFFDKKYMFFDRDLLSHMKKMKTLKSGCDAVDVYQWKQDMALITVKWSPAKQLILEYTHRINGKFQSVKLIHVDDDASLVSDFFEQLQQYKSTDFVDVGDNESDPFLRKMINLGYVDHSAKGFYNDQGDSLDKGHGHHH